MNIAHESAVIYLHMFWEDIAEKLSVTVGNINAKDFASGLKCLSSAFSESSKMVSSECGCQVNYDLSFR